MRAGITVLLGAGVVLAVLALVTGVTVCLRRGGRRRWIAWLTIGAAVGAAVEIAPRVVISRDVNLDCAGTTAHTSLSAAPVAWQILTGGLRVDVHIGPSQIRHIVTKRLASTALSDASVTLIDGAIEMSANVLVGPTTLPATVTLTPAVANGRLTLAPSGGTLAGRPLPAAVLGKPAGGGASGLAAGASAEASLSCDGGQKGTPTSATVDPGGLTVAMRL
ncbi:hypothetical protein [Streptomyces sp. NPDC054783]